MTPCSVKRRKDETVSFEKENTREKRQYFKDSISYRPYPVDGARTFYYFLVVNKPIVSQPVEQTATTADTISGTAIIYTNAKIHR
jgi:hypothetical protein